VDRVDDAFAVTGELEDLALTVDGALVVVVVGVGSGEVSGAGSAGGAVVVVVSATVVVVVSSPPFKPGAARMKITVTQ
jgi:hypothetical protein